MKKFVLLSFLLTSLVNSRGAAWLSEPFSYADGAVIDVSGGTWATHSGTAGEADVTAGALHLTENETEDVNVALPGGPLSDGNLYASFSVSLAALPSGDGNYFMHLKGSGNTGFRAKVFATTAGAAAGSFRLGIANGANGTPDTVLPVDLGLDTEYQVVMRYDLAGASSMLWIDPALEDDASGMAATDATSASTVSAIAFRQSTSSGNGMGDLLVDNLRVGASFSDVMPVPEPGGLLAFGLVLLAVWVLRLNR